MLIKYKLQTYFYRKIRYSKKMEMAYLILLTITCIIGLLLTNSYGAKILTLKLNFASWYFIVEFILTAVLATYTIDNIDFKTNWVFKLIPENEFPRFEVIWALSWCAISLPLGFILANFILKKMSYFSDYQHFLSKEFAKNSISKLFEKIWIAIILVYTTYTVYKIGFIPQLESLNWTVTEMALFRGKMTHHFPASVHLKELIGLRLIPIFSFYYFSKYLRTTNKKELITLSILIIISIFFATINLNKSGLAYYAIGLIITYGIVKNRVKLRIVIISFACVFILLLGSYYVAKKNSDLIHLTKGIYHRIIYTEAYANYYSFYFFPKEHKHLGFSSISKFIEYFGLEYSQTAPRIMMKTADQAGYKDGRAGYLTSSFISESWANWGILGIIFGPVIVGFIIKFIIGMLMNLPKSDLSCALIAFSSYSFKIGFGINNIIFPRYLLVIFILFLITYKLSHNQRAR